MSTVLRILALSSTVFAICLSGCATSLENLVKSPVVELQNVQLVGLGFNSQTFLLSFDVSNPNPFALPVRSVSYGIKLDGQRFAGGKTAGEFSVPANGETVFAISVDLNLLQTAPKLLAIVRQSAREDVTYELDGVLAVDLPFAPSVSYRNAGSIRLNP
ncbi:MAG: LEA type 2 family protein [Gammaproteobacteria bacterium]|nr:LEA type 2 family protein [Gammaproteobacteria bacterium]MBT8109544.1 LEA type 2 family protein [Gammaproteobacteria bacterium]NND46137.1 LEA type 2 family protein [Woeseiaceae bacterium]NNL44246.1 LEA type 2 family protein [Woeseiaceae bacterium]